MHSFLIIMGSGDNVLSEGYGGEQPPFLIRRRHFIYKLKRPAVFRGRAFCILFFGDTHKEAARIAPDSRSFYDARCVPSDH